MANIETLREHINNKYGGSQTKFGSAQTPQISPQHVGQLLKNDFLVIDGKLYLFRRNLRAI